MTQTPQQLVALIVDDQPANLSVLVDVLSRAGFKVLVAEDAESAFETVDRIAPDVCFLDVMLPGIDGYEICRRLHAKKNGEDVPVLFVTALGESVDRLRGLAAGGVDYVQKPIVADELLSRARAYGSLTALRRRVRRARTLIAAGDAKAAAALLDD